MSSSELTDLFEKVAKIVGTSHQEKAVSDFIVKYLTQLGLNAVIDNSAEKTNCNTGNVICEINGGGKKLLLSHMDTARTTDGLKIIRHEDKLTSDKKTVLGVDNRVGVTILLALAKQISENSLAGSGVTLAFTTCEETTLAGSKNLELNGNIERAFVFDSYLRPGNFIRSSIGASSFNIVIKGKASHAGISPEDGINAITIAASAIAKIKTGRIDNSTSINFGFIEGGTSVNVVPEKVFIKGEVRSNSKENIELQLNAIKNIFLDAAEERGGSINFNSDWDFMPFFIGDDQTVYKEIVKAITDAGLAPKAVESNGGSDANSMNERGIAAVNIGIGAQNPHSNNEFIYYEDLENSFQIALKLVSSNGL